MERQAPAERFMEAMRTKLCVYGARGTLAALELYAVDELFVAEHGFYGGLDASAWKRCAFERKVPVVHCVAAKTAAGRAFCSGVGVGAFLSRHVNPMDETPMSNASDECFFAHEAVTDASHGACVAETPRVEGDCSGVAWHTFTEVSIVDDLADESLCSLLLLWLRNALTEELPCEDAIALLEGARVILKSAEEEDSETIGDALVNVAAILEDNAPHCAFELPLRWEALLSASDSVDRVAAIRLPCAELSALHRPSVQTVASQCSSAEVIGEGQLEEAPARFQLEEGSEALGDALKNDLSALHGPIVRAMPSECPTAEAVREVHTCSASACEQCCSCEAGRSHKISAECAQAGPCQGNSNVTCALLRRALEDDSAEDMEDCDDLLHEIAALLDGDHPA